MKTCLLNCIILLFYVIGNQFTNAQCKPKIKIDGIETIADMDEIYGLHLPYWLKAGQSISTGSNVSKISIIEFTVDSLNSTLQFSQVIDVNSSAPQSVPENKVWKIESIAKIYTPSSYNSISYTSPGTYTFNVPNCAENICIEIWGAGGGGGAQSCLNSANCWPGGGGGGGGFGSQCFTVTPGQAITVVVGAGGGSATSGSNSSVIGSNVNIIATGGDGGASSIYSTFNGASIIAAGGTCSASSNSPGGNSIGLNGGSGGNGGTGGPSCTSGGYPGGGGAGCQGYNSQPGSGANGKVFITW